MSNRESKRGHEVGRGSCSDIPASYRRGWDNRESSLVKTLRQAATTCSTLAQVLGQFACVTHLKLQLLVAPAVHLLVDDLPKIRADAL